MEICQGLFILLCVTILILEKSYINAENELDTCPNWSFIKIKSGVLRGQKRDNYYAFEGIPYANPPIGDSRFEPSTLFSEKWKGFRDATKPGSVCMMWSHLKEVEGNEDWLDGNEDCLFLNVYTKHLNYKRPVLFFIHGGAFMFGNGDFYQPDIILARKDFVIVTINYRLGVLGFLSTEDKIVPGNMGMKDQVVALQWVQNNIAAFGGDPDNVILVGFSAGGASVHLHYMSELSRGLFSKGISHSGCALNSWVQQSNARQKANQVATYVGCPTGTNSEMVKCLKQKPAKDIVRSTKKFQPWIYNPFNVFGIVVESQSKNAFLTESPLKMLSSDKLINLPWILTTVEFEGIYNGAEILRSDHLIEELNERWDELLPYILHFYDTVPKNQQKIITSKIRQHYLGDKRITKNTFDDVLRVLTDKLYHYGIQKSVNLQAATNSAPVYVYFFTYPVKEGLGQYFSKDYEYKFGAGHGDDLFLVYRTNVMESYLPEEIKIANQLLDLYDNFFNNSTTKFGEHIIEPIDNWGRTCEKLNLLVIADATNIQMECKTIGEEDFWDLQDLEKY